LADEHNKAFEAYRKEAAAGNADAQYNLGVMYAQGLGVDGDLPEAMVWYRMAAEQGHTNAQAALDSIMRSAQPEENMKVWRVVRELVDIHLDPASEGTDELYKANELFRRDKYASAEPHYQSGIKKLRLAKEHLKRDGEALIRSLGRPDVSPEQVLTFALLEISEDLHYAEPEYQTARELLERGIEDAPDPTLVEKYDQAMAEKKAYRSGIWKSVAMGGAFVLLVTALLYTQWPWAGILFLVLGGLVVLLWSALDHHVEWPTWAHPLHDKDLTSLRPAKVLFSRWYCHLDDEHDPESFELQVLVRKKNGQRVEIAIPVPMTEEGGPGVPKLMGYDEVTAKLISVMNSEHDG